MLRGIIREFRENREYRDFSTTDSNGGRSREVAEVGLLQSKIVGVGK
jgi:hypothetical protein